MTVIKPRITAAVSSGTCLESKRCRNVKTLNTVCSLRLPVMHCELGACSSSGRFHKKHLTCSQSGKQCSGSHNQTHLSARHLPNGAVISLTGRPSLTNIKVYHFRGLNCARATDQRSCHQRKRSRFYQLLLVDFIYFWLTPLNENYIIIWQRCYEV